MRGIKRQVGGSRAGFSLMELSVVVGIILVLAAMLAPAMQKTKLGATRTRDLANLRAISQCILVYNAEKNILPGPVNRGIKIPGVIIAAERTWWLSTVLIDGGYCQTGDNIWKSPANLGAGKPDISYILNSTTDSYPEKFFGNRETGNKSDPLPVMQLKANIETTPPIEEPLGKIWMLCNADGENYGPGPSGGSQYAVPDTFRTPWGGRNYSYFDGHAEFIKRTTPSTYPSSKNGNYK